MAKKKNTQKISISQQDNMHVHQVLEQYHRIAEALHKSTDQKQAETALTEINNLAEGAQIALLNALAKARHTNAADILLAINELSPLKSVSKEARRALIRLEGARIHPARTPPVQQPLAAIQSTNTPLHFWKGNITRFQ